MLAIFYDWAKTICPDAEYINADSAVQIQALLFGHFENKERIHSYRIFEREKTPEELKSEMDELFQRNPYANMSIAQLKEACGEKGLPKSGTRAALINSLLVSNDKSLQGNTSPVEDSKGEKSLTSSFSREKRKKELSKLLVKDLRIMVAESGLKESKSLKKAGLIDHLLNLEEKKVVEEDIIALSNQCAALGLSKEGSIEDLRARLAADRASNEEDNAVADFQRELQLKHEEEARRQHGTNSLLTVPKKVKEFTVTSFGLDPIEFTPGGGFYFLLATVHL